ncbi:HEAT repeat domain-containing protein [Priestia aryabhattai]|uniref:HEAT repeat domain-containing protein n=1 Tax=Priestia aryabhattai TaxID=412384 RepID=A0AAX6NE58_PRIAR|nr:HEAT repeat domain-containing protein [Priestia aryabhattai]MDU9694203.1 HEAT repeat domain-containing protein [Priestia aryabhattai]
MKLSDMISTFIDEVKKQLERQQNGNITAANEHADQIVNMANKLKKSGSSGKSELINLAKHEDPYVRLWAACNLDDTAREFAIKVLTELAQHTNEDYGHSAQIQLDFNM